jgi:hypothetical protein
MILRAWHDKDDFQPKSIIQTWDFADHGMSCKANDIVAPCFAFLPAHVAHANPKLSILAMNRKSAF